MNERERIAKASEHISGYLSISTVNGRTQGYSTAAVKDKQAEEKGGGHPLMPNDKATHHAVHRALRAVHRATFETGEHDTIDKAKKAHKLLVDASKPDDDDDDKKRGK